MKKYILTALVLLLAVSFWNCEKDDICAETTPTTPRLVISFYDATTPDVLKNITNLGIVEAGATNGISYNGVSKIIVPLRTNHESTTFNFVLNGSDDDATNDIIDIVTLNYSTLETYISRACGYKTTFKLNEINGFMATNNWILVDGIIQYSIENENETHVKIFF